MVVRGTAGQRGERNNDDQQLTYVHCDAALCGNTRLPRSYAACPLITIRRSNQVVIQWKDDMESGWPAWALRGLERVGEHRDP